MDPLEKYKINLHPKAPELKIPGGTCTLCGADVVWIVDSMTGITAICDKIPFEAYTFQGRRLEAYKKHECKPNSVS